MSVPYPPNPRGGDSTGKYCPRPKYFSVLSPPLGVGGYGTDTIHSNSGICERCRKWRGLWGSSIQSPKSFVYPAGGADNTTVDKIEFGHMLKYFGRMLKYKHKIIRKSRKST